MDHCEFTLYNGCHVNVFIVYNTNYSYILIYNMTYMILKLSKGLYYKRLSIYKLELESDPYRQVLVFKRIFSL